MNKFWKTFNLGKNLFKVAGLSLTLLAFSCQEKQETITPQKTTQTDVADKALVHQHTGVDMEHIGHTHDGLFTIQGDIVIPPSWVELWKSGKTPQDKHRRVWVAGASGPKPLVTNKQAYQYIPVYIENSVPDAWKTATVGAMNQLTGLSNSSLKFERVWDASKKHITIKGQDLNNYKLFADAQFPYWDDWLKSYKAGTLVRVNTNAEFRNDATKKVIMMHELMHTLGFAHMEESASDYIEGTWSEDSNSIMLTYVANKGYITALSEGDKHALRKLFP